MTNKLFIVLIPGLGVGAKVAQGCHALRAFVADQPGYDIEWFFGHHVGPPKAGTGAIVVLEAPSADLHQLIERLAYDRVPFAIWREPDMGNAITALAVHDSGSYYVRNFKLVT